MVLWVKDSALLLLRLGSLLWCGSLWPGNFCMLRVQPKRTGPPSLWNTVPGEATPCLSYPRLPVPSYLTSLSPTSAHIHPGPLSPVPFFPVSLPSPPPLSHLSVAYFPFHLGPNLSSSSWEPCWPHLSPASPVAWLLCELQGWTGHSRLCWCLPLLMGDIITVLKGYVKPSPVLGTV